MLTETRARRRVLGLRIAWVTAITVALVGCRDSTCFDTATCFFPVDAAVSEDNADGGSFQAADASMVASSNASTPNASSEHSTRDATSERPATASGEETVNLTSPGSADPTDVPSASSSVNTASADNQSAGASSADATSVEATSSLDQSTSGRDATLTSSSEEAGGPSPSTGCGKANPSTGTSGSPLSVSNHQYYVKLPQSYDPNTAYPVVIMFNPTGNPITWAESAAGFETAAADWIRVYPHMANQSNGWGPSDVAFFEPFYEKITGDYCMDTDRIFAAGESSGGDFAGILGCEHADKVRSVAPCATKFVSAYDTDVEWRLCTGQVTSIVIHGKNDNVVGPENGPKMRDFYKALNHCDDTTVPVDGYTDTLSNCVKFEGCDAGFDTYWCSHADPEYNNTNHGWPHFAAEMLVETWARL
jgi:polyhydroxybutyrate depolymerase